MLDKENGGKADALNAGINAASHPYFCAVDADAILEVDSLLRIVTPVDRRPGRDGRRRRDRADRQRRDDRQPGGSIEFRLPKDWLACLQVVEYFRAFLIGRIGWDSMDALLIVSGAFGLFRRSLVEEVGGYATDTVGEDMELVVRLHRQLRARTRSTASHSCPSRCAGPRRRRTYGRWGASAGAGSAGSDRRSGDIAGCS